MSRKSKKSAFRSTFEEDVAKILQEFDYEPFTIPYTISRSYRPDFVDASGLYLIECKGYFRDGDQGQPPRGQELIFVLMQPNKRIRKGAKMTMAQWCDKEKILWYNIETLQELISYVTNARGS